MSEIEGFDYESRLEEDRHEAAGGMGAYLRETRQSTYTFVLVAPFVLIYEVGLIALQLSRSDFHARNGADALIRNILFPLGMQRAGTGGAIVWSAASVLVLTASYLIWRSRERSRAPMRLGYVGWQFAEAAGWAMVLYAGSMIAFSALVHSDSARAAAEGTMLSASAEVVFNAGAGVYEELVFRVLLVLVLWQLCRRILHMGHAQSGVVAVVVASVVFSLMHFGNRPGADPWDSNMFAMLFAFRFGAGLFFSVLFYYRSFGVAVAAHALYDNFVTLGSVMRAS